MWAFIAMVSFSGCFLECSEPDPFGGVLTLSAALILVAAPLLVAWSILKPGSPAGSGGGGAGGGLGGGDPAATAAWKAAVRRPPSVR